MDVLVLSPDFAPALGGTQVYAGEIAGRLHERGRVRVVAPRMDGCEDIDARLPYEVVRVEGGASGFPVSAAAVVRRSVVRDGFGTAFATLWPGALAALLGRPGGSGMSVHVAAHGRELLVRSKPAALGAAQDAVRAWVLRNADGIYPVSRYTARLAERAGAPRDRLHVVENGADPHLFRPEDGVPFRREHRLGNRPVILTVCRLVSRKGVDIVLRALPDVLTERPEAVLVVAGDGPEGPALRELAVNLGIARSVRWIGPIEHDRLPGVFAAADVFVLAPRESPPEVEGFGLVYLEAGACGVPVVGTRTGGIRDAVQDGVTGLLVPPEDPDAVAAAILCLLNETGLADELGEAGRRRVLDRSNWDRVADRLLGHMATGHT